MISQRFLQLRWLWRQVTASATGERSAVFSSFRRVLFPPEYEALCNRDRGGARGFCFGADGAGIPGLVRELQWAGLASTREHGSASRPAEALGR
eukprot:scaffold1307_cov200-Pinguiococcus_pyrenoidosus.AAC.70